MVKKLLIALAVLASCLAGLFILSRPAALNFLGRHSEPLLGFSFQVADLDLSPRCVRAQGLLVSSGGLRASVETASLKANPGRLRIEEVTIEGARLHYVYDPGGPAGPAGDYQKALAGLPSVGRLTVRKAAADLTSKDGAWTAKATSLSATLEDFSPRGGGKLPRGRFSFSAQVQFATSNGLTEAAGKISGGGNLSALLPRPVGRASLEADLSGKVAGRTFEALELKLPLEARQDGLLQLAAASVTVRQLQLAPGARLETARLSLPAAVDLGRRTFQLSGARAEVAGLGGLGLKASGRWEPGSPLSVDWRVGLAADSLEVAKLRKVAEPYLSSLADWQAGGRAELAADLAGRYRQGLTYEGELRLALRQGSFSSPDYAKAGENIAATVVLRVRSAAPQKAGFEAALELPQGQLLAGGILADLARIRPRLSAEGSFFLPPARRPS